MESEHADAAAPVDVYHVGEGRCLVWDAPGAERLRRQHRLVGCLLGSFPQHKQQNLFHTLPLLLMPEEVSVALKRGWIRLLDDSVPYAEPQTADKAAHELSRREAQAQREKERAEHRAKEIRYWEQRTNDSSNSSNSSSSQNKKDKKKKKRKADEDDSAGSTVDEAASVSAGDNDDARAAGNESKLEAPETLWSAAPPPPPELASAGSGGGGGMALRAGEVGGKPWRREERAIGWDEWQRCMFPRDAPQAARRQAVFEDLWLRPNCYITSGGKFGGDFLVYPGDPLMYHAAYIVIVVGWEEPLAPLDMVAVGRLAVGVKKATVFASVRHHQETQNVGDGEQQTQTQTSYPQVTYVTIDWRGVT